MSVGDNVIQRVTVPDAAFDIPQMMAVSVNRCRDHGFEKSMFVQKTQIEFGRPVRPRLVFILVRTLLRGLACARDWR